MRNEKGAPSERLLLIHCPPLVTELEHALHRRRNTLDRHGTEVVQAVSELLNGLGEGIQPYIEAVEFHVEARNSERRIGLMLLLHPFATTVLFCARKCIKVAFVGTLFRSPPEWRTLSRREHIAALDAVNVE